MSEPFISSHYGAQPPPIDALVVAADDEEHAFVRRTVDEWSAGVNRFERPGEAFFVASVDSETVGMCGVNIDGYLDDPSVGRLRHLYVHPVHRAGGLGERLVMTCLDHAAEHFTVVRLRTPGPKADRFYDQLGFERSNSDTATHVCPVGNE